MKIWKFKFSLAYKVGLLIIAAVLITSLTLNFIFRGHYLKDEMEHIEGQVMTISKLTSQQFAQHILKKEFKAMHENIVDDIDAIQHISDMQVYDKDGYLICDKYGIQKNTPPINLYKRVLNWHPCCTDGKAINSSISNLSLKKKKR